jgi:hypothetical protein
MSNQAYVGTAKRTFQQALIHLLETDYGLLGSQRILKLLAKDVQKLVDQFYPAPDRLRSGWMVFTGTKACGPKAHPGQSAADHQLVTLAWPVVLPEDLQQLSEGAADKQSRLKWFQKRLVRILEYGLNHPDGPVLLTQADLSAMTGLNTVQISKLLEEARQSTGKDLLTKGYFFDQGMRPTHKEAVIELYEQGLDEVDIARRTQHAQSSVGRYIRDYERVKLLYKRLIQPEQISRLLDLQPNVVQAYLAFSEKYHPVID